jgi:hypothetical protein
MFSLKILSVNIFYSLISLSFSFEQVDITDTSIVQKFQNFELNPEFQKREKFDTLLIYFQRYNPATRSLYNTLGNIGLAHQSLIFNQIFSPGFNFENNNFLKWELVKDNIHHFNTRIPYTDVQFVVGSNQEQYFKGLHSQNITPNWNFGFYFNKIRSEGYFLNQKTDVTNIGFQNSYLSINKRYGNSIKGYYNNLYALENGGLVTDSIYDMFSATQLRGASNRRVSRGVSLKHFYNFWVINDTIRGDEDTATNINFKVKGGVFHEFDYSLRKRIYADNFPSSDFYPEIIFDSIRTFDSIRYSLIENRIGWEVFSKNISYRFYGEHQLGSVYFNHLSARDSIISNYTIGAKIRGGNKGKLHWNFNSKYFVFGTNRNDYLIDGQIEYDLQFYGKIGAGIRQVRSTPDFIFNRYFSNHFVWQNNFNKTHSFAFNLFYHLPQQLLKIKYSSGVISNYVFFNELALPEQIVKAIAINSIEIEKILRFKKMFITNEIVGQFLSGSQIIRIPKLVYRGSIFYEFTFGGAMKLQPGVEVLYFSKYLAYAYMPVTSQFYLQNRQWVGDYPFVDFFVNMKVKQVRFFVKLEHLNHGIGSQEYLLFPNYPQRARAFRVGLNWIFLN